MINSRAKGARSLAKAKAHATSLGATCVVLHQQTGWWKTSTAQPFDLMVFYPHHPPILVEVRSNQWGLNKPQTLAMAALPGIMPKQIWLFRNGFQTPIIRQWEATQGQWGHAHLETPWRDA